MFSSASLESMGLPSSSLRTPSSETSVKALASETEREEDPKAASEEHSSVAELEEEACRDSASSTE